MMKTLLVADYMSSNVDTLQADAPLLTATRQLLARKRSGVPVVDREGRLVGVLSEADCLRGVLLGGYVGQWQMQVADVMSQEVEVVTPQTTLLRVAEQFVLDGRRRLPVVDNGKLVGLISRKDTLAAVAAQAGTTHRPQSVCAVS